MNELLSRRPAVNEKEVSASPRRFVREEIRSLPVYSLHQVECRYKLDQNEVPWDVPARFKREATRRLNEHNWARYPDFHSDELRQRLAHLHDWPLDGVLVGNGSNELLSVALEALAGPGSTVLSAAPTFGLYDMFVRRSGARLELITPRDDLRLPFEEMLAAIESQPQRPLLLCSPNNPTGDALSVEQCERLLAVLDAPLLLDNAYGEFCAADYRPLLLRHRHLVVFRTLSKAWSLAGLRLGYVLADPDLIAELLKVKLPYNLGHAGAVAGQVVLEERAWGERCVRILLARRAQWIAELRGLGLEVFASQGNFFLVRHPHIEAIRGALLDHGILVRKVSHYPGLAGCARFAVGSGAALRATVRVLKSLLPRLEDRP